MTSARATEALFNQYHRRLHSYLSRAVGQTEAARDLTQEVFVRVSRSAVPASPEQATRAWLFRIARNLAIDHNRGARRQGEVQPMAADSVSSSRSASQDVSAAVNQALEALDPLDRDVFLLREVSGLTWDEIASACDLSRDAVRSRIHRARLELKDRLAAPIAVRIESPLRRKFMEGE